MKEEKGSVIKLTMPEGYICSTVAYAPADDPQVAIIIIVDEPTKGSLYGSTVAAPYVSDALENILPYLGIKPSTEETE
jgi:stage V sporulation protein D (sporulation-specific penicillin-binding protein)